MNFWYYILTLAPLLVILFQQRKLITALASGGVHVDAEIVDLHQKSAGLLNRKYFYVVAYEMDGKMYRSELRRGYWYPTEYQLGEKMRIIVGKKAPPDVISMSLRGRYGYILSQLLLVTIFLFGVLFFFDKSGVIHSGVPPLFGTISLCLYILCNVVRHLRLLIIINRFDTTIGTIIGFRNDRDANLDTVYVPLVRYDVGGKFYEFSPNEYHFDQPKLGSSCVVRYLTANPKIAETQASSRYWGLIFWAIAFAVVVIHGIIYLDV